MADRQSDKRFRIVGLVGFVSGLTVAVPLLLLANSFFTSPEVEQPPRQSVSSEEHLETATNAMSLYLAARDQARKAFHD